MKHWVFDLDGTLVDSFALYFEALSEVFAAHGREFPAELHHEALTRPLPELFSEHLGEKAVESAMAALQSRSLEDTARVQPFEGVGSMLADLAGSGARIAVWTNRDLESARLILERTGLARFAELCVSGTCVQRKPHTEGLRRILEHFGCRAHEVTVVGDHDHDVTAPKEVGARSVRASWHAYWDIGRCHESDRQFYSLREFTGWALRSSQASFC